MRPKICTQHPIIKRQISEFLDDVVHSILDVFENTTNGCHWDLNLEFQMLVALRVITTSE